MGTSWDCRVPKVGHSVTYILTFDPYLCVQGFRRLSPIVELSRFYVNVETLCRI